MNRKQRRDAQKAQPRFMRMTQEDRIKALLKNGITPADVEKAQEEAYQQGFMNGTRDALQQSYAAICMLLIQRGQTSDQAKAFLRDVDNALVYSISGQEDAMNVLEKYGIAIDFAEVERVV